jgi:hypothetical protein
MYRRQSGDCRVHKFRLKAYEKKYFKDCDCPIWLTGSTDKERYPRQALGVRDWAAAEAKLRSLDAESKDETVHGPKLDDCIERYLDGRDNVTAHPTAEWTAQDNDCPHERSVPLKAFSSLFGHQSPVMAAH